MKIKLGTIDHGDRDIFVDDVRWGRIKQTRHGTKGSHYHFEDVRGHRIFKPGEVKGRSCTALWLVYGGAMALRHEESTEPLKDRLLYAVNQMIECGALRNPDLVCAEAKAKREKFEREQAQMRVDDAAELRAKAREAIDFSKVNLASAEIEDLTDRIVDAMRWAQSH